MRVREPVWMHDVGLRPIARFRKVHDRRFAQAQRRFERPADNLLPLEPLAAAHGIVFRRDHAWQLVEKLTHVRRQHACELLEGALDLVAKRRARQRLEERPAEVECAELRQREACSQPFECLAVDPPPRAAIFLRLVVVERESRGFERL
jgi:hypothetical protein